MKNYRELVIAIETHTHIRDGLEISLNYWIKKRNKSGPREMKGQNYSNLDMPRGGSDDSTLDKIQYNIDHYTYVIQEENNIIDGLQVKLDNAKENMKKSNEIKDKVAYLKYEKNEDGRKKHTLEGIAEILGYSEGYIKNISKEV